MRTGRVPRMRPDRTLRIVPGMALLGIATVLGIASVMAIADSTPLAPEPTPGAEEKVGPTGEPEEHLAEEEPPPVLQDTENCLDDAWNPGGYPDGDPGLGDARVSFVVKAGDEVIPYRLMSLFVLPGESVSLEALLTSPDSRFHAEAPDGGTLASHAAGSWRWIAPGTPGVYRVDICDLTYDETIHLKMFVMRLYAGETRLGGYLIGDYETVPLHGDPSYERIQGLVEVDPGVEDEWLTPHFQLRQFLCKQPSGFPKYLHLRTRLLLKLEMLLERVNEGGNPASTLYVVSGYRTPWYNAAIGNVTRYSRHAYGDAADVFVDEDRDGEIDDLNRDGRTDDSDAGVLYALVESLGDEAWYAPFMGGLGFYPANDERDAFIHVDSRGARARW